MKKIVVILISITLIWGANLYGQNQDYMELARRTLEEFSYSVTDQNAKYYGLSSPDVLKTVKPGDPVIHYAVGLNSLKEYTADMDPEKIITEMGYVTVPLVNPETGKVETFVMLSRIEGKFQPAGMGQAPYSMNFMVLTKRAEVPKDARLIRIPALNMAYIGMTMNDTLKLIPILNKDQMEFIPEPASMIFEELGRQVKDLKEDVPH
ncbi:MAG: hypothetical protein P8100_00760 [bacterium]